MTSKISTLVDFHDSDEETLSDDSSNTNLQFKADPQKKAKVNKHRLQKMLRECWNYQKNIQSFEILHVPVILESVLQKNLCLDQIQCLNLINCQITAPDCLTLARDCRLNNLKKIDLSLNRFGAPGLRNLLRGDQRNFIERIEELQVYGCAIKIGDQKCIFDVEMVQFRKLKVVNLSYNVGIFKEEKITKHLFPNKKGSRLETLICTEVITSHNQGIPKVIEENLKNLLYLDLSKNCLNLTNLFELPFTKLETLIIRNHSKQSLDIKKKNTWPNLRVMDLSNSLKKGFQFQELWFPKLEALIYDDNQLGSEGLLEILTHEGLLSVKSLSVRSNRIYAQLKRVPQNTKRNRPLKFMKLEILDLSHNPQTRQKHCLEEFKPYFEGCVIIWQKPDEKESADEEPKPQQDLTATKIEKMAAWNPERKLDLNLDFSQIDPKILNYLEQF